MSQVTSEPTLASIPGILFRTLTRLVARGVFFIAAITLTITVALIACSLLLATWRSPRTPKTQAIADVLIAVTQAYREFRH